MKNVRVCAVWNGKGGVGKTTMSVNLAYNFSRMGKKVLIVDWDPQCNTTPFFTRADDRKKTVLDITEDFKCTRNCISRTKYKSIDIIKGNTYLTEESVDYSDNILDYALQEVEDDYDIILIDCRPSFEHLTMNALYAADILLTPMLLDGFCKDNLALVERTYLQVQDKFSEKELSWMVVANKVRNLNAARRIYSELMEKYDYPLVNTCITDRAAVITASGLKKPLSRHRRKDIATADFKELAKELLEDWYGKSE